ncbi:MAG TPA: hypothetical protein VE093_34045 [Polyangiaceae bacterium]|jgi:hypothetical protein|nr:hypothetical protein [Polyangiaceae bacterium]
MVLRIRGRVVDGHLRVDTPVDLPNNTEVELTVDVPETDDERELRESIARSDAQIARGEVLDADDVLDELCPSVTHECRATG